jgi:HEAT repeat protein
MKTSSHRLLLGPIWLIIIVELLIPYVLLSADNAAILLEQMQNRKNPKEIDQAIRQILDENVQVDRETYLERLAFILSDEHMPVSLRELSAYALGKARKQATNYIPNLEHALRDSKDWQVQRAAAEALGRIGSPADDVEKSLSTAEQEKANTTVKAACLLALARLDRPSDGVKRLTNALEDSNSEEVQRAAAYTLAQMGPIAASGATRILVASITTHNQATDKNLVEVDVWALGLIGPDAAEESSAVIPTLTNMLHDRRGVSIRRNAAIALQHIGLSSERYDYVVTDLSAQLKAEADLDTKIAMAVTLAALGNGPHGSAANALFETLRSSDDRALQQAVCIGLSKVPPPENANVPLLIDIAREEYPDVRVAAFDAIGHIHQRPDAAIPVLVDALQHDRIPSVRVAAIEALGHFKSLGSMYGKVLEGLVVASYDTQTRFVAVKTLGVLGDTLQLQFQNSVDTPDFSLEVPLQNAVRAVQESQKAEPNNNDFVEAGKSLAEARKILARKKLRQQVLDAYSSHPLLARVLIAIAAYFVWIVLLYTVVLRLFPLRLLQWNGFLKGLGTVKMSTFFAMKLRTMLLWNAYKDSRVLAAWVDAHAETARVNFIKQCIKNTREIFHPLPVEIDGQVVSELQAAALREFCKPRKWFLRVVGEGGLGKTTIACQIALWALENDKEKRLVKDHRMLPVLLERAGNLTFLQDWSQFKAAVRGKLQDLISEAKPIPEWLCDKLIEDSRLLVIIDGPSEMTSAAEPPLPLKPDYSVAALIVTSRSEELWSGVHHTNIRPLRIDSDHLSSFMHAYLGRNTKLADHELFDACRRLAAMMGARSITPLLARMYAEQLGQPRELSRGLPNNIPDLMLGYVSTLNRNHKAEDPDQRTVRRAAQLAAWECCKTTYSAGYASKDKVYSEFASHESLKQDLLDYLELRLQLVRTIPPAQSYIEFSFDLIADYLAGMWLVQVLKNDEQWLEFLDAVDRREDKTEPEPVVAFLVAVLECCIHNKTEFKASRSILERLSDRIQHEGRPSSADRLRTYSATA